jgi:predicted SprT family Zn-dependent metalloprotease
MLRTKSEAYSLISKLTEKHDVSDYTIKLVQKCKKRTTVACCYRILKRFDFVEHYATHLTEKDFIELILHEIAHALTPNHGHDRVFRNMCYRIGGQPFATSNVSYAEKTAPSFLQKKVNYIYTCPVCPNEMKTTKKLKRTYSCCECSPRVFNTNFAMVLTTNLREKV